MTIQDVLKTIVTYTIAFVMVSMLIITMPLILDTHQSMSVSTRNGAISYLNGIGYVVLAQAGTPLAEDLYTRNVYPGSDSTFDIGASGNKYAEGHFDTVYSGGDALPTEGIQTFKALYDNGSWLFDVKPVAQTEVASTDAHGLVYNSGFLYIAHRSVVGVVTKLATDFSTAITTTPVHGITDATDLTDIIISAGFLWTIDNTGWLYKINLTTLADVGSWDASDVADGLVSDGTTIYIVGDEFANKFTIGNSSMGSAVVHAGREFHGVTLSGASLFAMDNANNQVVKLATADLSLTGNTTVYVGHTDDVVNDGTYVYLASEDPTYAVVTRVKMSNLAVFGIAATDEGRHYGIAMNTALSMPMALDRDHNVIWIKTVNGLSPNRVIGIHNLDYSDGIGEIVNDGTHYYLTQFASTRTPVIKLLMSDVDGT